MINRNKIIKEEEDHSDLSLVKLNKIMEEETNHWSYAKKFYEIKFPKSNIKIAFQKEKIKNKMRLFYFKNFIFLDKIFNPVIDFFILIFGNLASHLKTNSSENKNLLMIDPISII